MLLPTVFHDDLFDTWMAPFDRDFDRDFFGGRNPLYGKREKNLMKTDVRETAQGYEVDVDLPGFKKEDVTVQLDSGYLTISAAKTLDKDEQPEGTGYIRRERYAGSCTRTFYVGEALSNEDIRAKLDSGILHLTFPKKDAPQLEQNKYIAIEE